MRAWISFALVWIAAIAATGAVSWIDRPQQFVVTNSKGVKYAVRASQGTSERDVISFVRSKYGEEDQLPGCLTTPHPASCDAPVNAGALPGTGSPPNVWYLSALGLGVPASILLGAIGIYWVLAGFSTRPSASNKG